MAMRISICIPIYSYKFCTRIGTRLFLVPISFLFGGFIMGKKFSETVDKATDKIDEAAVKVENFFTKTVSFFKSNWKWLLSDVICVVAGLIVGKIL